MRKAPTTKPETTTPAAPSAAPEPAPATPLGLALADEPTPEPGPVMVALANVTRDAELICRADGLSADTVAEYAASMLDGAAFPAAVLFFDGSTHWIGSGNHRVAACEQAGRSEVLARVRQGGRAEALIFAAGSNSTHGLRRTNADKRKAILLVLAAKPELAHAEIARICAVSDKTVTAALATSEIPKSPDRLGADGKMRSLPKAKRSKKRKPGAKLDKSGLLRDWAKLAKVRNEFRELGDRWSSSRPDLAEGFAGVIAAIARLDGLMSKPPPSTPATMDAKPDQASALSEAPKAARRRIVHATGNGGAS